MTIPQGRVRRTAPLAALSARAAGGGLVEILRRRLKGERGTSLEFHLRTAERYADALSRSKGVLMKVGQIVSFVDAGPVLEGPYGEVYRAALASLQADAEPMEPVLVAAMIESELGRPPEELFADFSPTPIAAASIGQVHRAITHDGRAVAVKVQYPGIDDAIRADLDNTALLFRLLGLAFPGLEPGPLVSELRARLLEELDYTIEASNQQLFADWYAGHPFIHVPAVVRELSTARVLTSELATGTRFDEVARGWDQHERDLAGETIFRFVFRGIYRIHAFNGDPHPGNYLFAPGGHVTFLDFGLVKRFTAAEVRVFADLITAMAIDRDVARFRAIAERIGLLQPDPSLSDEMVREFFGHFYEFVMDDRPVTFTADYASASVRTMFDLTSETAAVSRRANVPSAFVVTQRINLGLHAVLAQLHATANWRRIAEELWPFVNAPPSTALGEHEAEWLASHPRP